MSGFVAAVSLSGAPVPDEQIRALADAYSALRGGADRRSAGEGTATQVVTFDAELTVTASGWLARQGQAYGHLGCPTTRADIEGADGQYCLISHDSVQNSSLAATDRFAAAPLYVARAGGLLYVCTSAMVLALHLRPRASEASVRNFLVAGHQFGQQTHWDSIRRLDPGTLVHVHARRINEQSYWRPRVNADVERLGLRAAASYVTDLAVATLKERAGSDPTWLDLTGGYDSRLLALLAHEAGVPFAANTRESVNNQDVPLARIIASRKGWDWRPIRLPSDWAQQLPKQIDRSLAWGDGRLEVLQLSRVMWAHAQLALDRSRLLSAGGGEHLQYYAWNTELPFPGRSGDADIARWVDFLAIKPADFQVLTRGSRELTRADFIDRFKAWVAPYHGEPTTRQLDLSYAYKTSGHFGAYRAADDANITAQLPYFFEPIFSAAFSVHHRHRNGFRLMREMMDTLDPVVAAVETTRGGPATPMRWGTLHRYLPYYSILARKGVNKLSEKATGRPWLPFRLDYLWKEDDANAAVVESLLDSGVLDWQRLRIRSVLSDDGVRRLAAGDVGSAMLGRVLTAELALALTRTEL